MQGPAPVWSWAKGSCGMKSKQKHNDDRTSCCNRFLLYDIQKKKYITIYHNISQYITSNALPMLLGRVVIAFSALACTLSTWVSLNRMRPWGLKPLSKSSSHSWPKSLGQLGQLYEWCRNKRKHTGSYRLSNPTMKFVCWSEYVTNWYDELDQIGCFSQTSSETPSKGWLSGVAARMPR